MTITLKNRLRYLLPLVIALLIFATNEWINANPKKLATRPTEAATLLQVDIEPIARQNHQTTLYSYGHVTAKYQSDVAAEVAGAITYISPNFETGKHLEADEIIARLDDRQLQADLAVAKAELSVAQAAFDEELARAKQARKDWRQLHGDRPPPELAVRIPQQASAKANISAAEARIQKAEARLADTIIKAPFDSTVISRHLDLGELATPNTPLGTLISRYHREVRLPLTVKEAQLLSPSLLSSEEQNSPGTTSINSTQNSPIEEPHTGYVTLKGASKVNAWASSITQVVEESSQKQFLIVDYINPEASPDEQLMVGEFVNATIPGRTLQEVVTIPAETLYEGRFVYLVDDEGLLQRREISLQWREKQRLIVKSGLAAGDQLVITPLGRIASGTPVEITN